MSTALPALLRRWRGDRTPEQLAALPGAPSVRSIRLWERGEPVRAASLRAYGKVCGIDEREVARVVLDELGLPEQAQLLGDAGGLR